LAVLSWIFILQPSCNIGNFLILNFFIFLFVLFVQYCDKYMRCIFRSKQCDGQKHKRLHGIMKSYGPISVDYFIKIFYAMLIRD